MKRKKISKDYFDKLITDYVEGRTTIKGEHPKDVKRAIDSFFHAGKMMIDYPVSVPNLYTKTLNITHIGMDSSG
jgi:hypothetical protein